MKNKLILLVPKFPIGVLCTLLLVIYQNLINKLVICFTSFDFTITLTSNSFYDIRIDFQSSDDQHGRLKIKPDLSSFKILERKEKKK